MQLEQFFPYIFTFNSLIVIFSIFLLVFSKKIVHFLDTTDLQKRKVTEKDEEKIKKKQEFLMLTTLVILVCYFASLYLQIPFLSKLIKSLFVILIVYILNGLLIRKILFYYGNEIEITGETYFKKGYKANIFSILTNFISFLIGLFVCLHILELDSVFKAWGVLAGILAFIGFTASVWAPDFMASIFILHHDSMGIWNVIYIRELKMYAWIKNINLSEIKIIDLKYSRPIIFRPSKFRELTIENLSQGIVWKATRVLRTVEIKVGYEHNLEEVKKVCFHAFDDLVRDLEAQEKIKYFPEEVFRDVKIENFWDHAVHYRFVYYITNPFYLIKIERMLNEKFQKYQKEYGVYFSTPYLVNMGGK